MIIDAVKTFIKTYSGLDEDSLVEVNHLDGTPINYAIFPIPGEIIVKKDIVGNTVREFSFAFESTESTEQELKRIQSVGFYENFAAWLESQSKAKVLPVLGAGKTAIKIEATRGGYLMEQGESGTGIYQILGKLTYKQQA